MRWLITSILDMVEPVSMESKNFSKTTNGLIEIYRCVKIYIDGHTPVLKDEVFYILDKNIEQQIELN
jgi:hypothetical protein